MTQDPRLTFGHNLRAKRVAKGISVRELARQTGISSAYVRHMEDYGGAPPAEERVKAFARALGEPEDDMLALAGYVPADVKALLLARPAVMYAFIRTLGNASDETLEMATSWNLQAMSEFQSRVARKVLPFRAPQKNPAERTSQGAGVR